MRILNWVQSKIGGKHDQRKPDVFYPTPARYHAPDTRKEEFSDWPHGLLAIGTFGNRISENENNISAMEDLKNFTVEEVDKLQKQLANILVSRNHDETADESDSGSCPNGASSINNIDKMDWKKTLSELDNEEEVDDGDDELRPPSSRISLSDSNRSKVEMFAINHKSVSFLCRKMFARRAGFAGIPTGFRDPLPKSIMEKILKAILQKKIYPQNNTTPALTRKYSERKLRVGKNVGSEEKILSKPKQEEYGSKWVKTDSEFIVLEI